MSDRKWRTWEVLGLIFVLAAGNLLHFVYEWCGESPIAGVLASVNESTWEHMKLLTTPWVLWSIVELIALRRTGLPVLTARAAGLLAGLAAIPLLFYGYQVSCETTNDSSFIHSVHQNDSVPVRADGQIRNLYH